MAKVYAFNKTTGRKRLVPEEWLSHPVLGKDLELAPSERGKHAAEDSADERPTEPEAVEPDGMEAVEPLEQIGRAYDA